MKLFLDTSLVNSIRMFGRANNVSINFELPFLFRLQVNQYNISTDYGIVWIFSKIPNANDIIFYFVTRNILHFL